MKIYFTAILICILSSVSLAVPTPKFQPMLPAPKFKQLFPTPKFTPLKTTTGVVIVPLKVVEKAVQTIGHWETRCNGQTCQKVWVPGPKPESKKPTTTTRRRWYR